MRTIVFMIVFCLFTSIAGAEELKYYNIVCKDDICVFVEDTEPRELKELERAVDPPKIMKDPAPPSGLYPKALPAPVVVAAIRFTIAVGQSVAADAVKDMIIRAWRAHTGNTNKPVVVQLQKSH